MQRTVSGPPTFHDEFTQLDQIALGIGNNPDANDSGIGLAGGAIMVGGVRPDAHHPSRPWMSVRDILISNNLVRTVSQHYREQAAILVTHASGAVIWHNDVSGTPYDGIDIGWGWARMIPAGVRPISPPIAAITTSSAI